MFALYVEIVHSLPEMPYSTFRILWQRISSLSTSAFIDRSHIWQALYVPANGPSRDGLQEPPRIRKVHSSPPKMAGIRPMIKKYPLERAAGAYA